MIQAWPRLKIDDEVLSPLSLSGGDGLQVKSVLLHVWGNWRCPRAASCPQEGRLSVRADEAAGGRWDEFWQSQRNVLVIVGPSVPGSSPSHYLWHMVHELALFEFFLQ